MDCSVKTIKAFSFSMSEEEYNAICADLNVVTGKSEVSEAFIAAGNDEEVEEVEYSEEEGEGESEESSEESSNLF